MLKDLVLRERVNVTDGETQQHNDRLHYISIHPSIHQIHPATYLPTYLPTCGRSPAEIVGSNPTGGMDIFLLSVVCCQVEVSATS